MADNITLDIQKVKQLIAEGKLEKAITTLLSLEIGEYNKLKVQMLKFRLNRVNSRYTEGTLSEDIYKTEVNKIAKSVLLLVSSTSFQRGQKCQILTIISIVVLSAIGLKLLCKPSNNSLPLIEQNCKFDKKDTANLKIVLLPFNPDIKCKELDINYKKQIVERLDNKRLNEGLSIRLLPNLCDTTISCPTSDEQARKIGNDVQADMVVWGSYEEDANGVKSIRLRYALLSNFYIDGQFRKSDTEMKGLKDLQQLREGYLQEDIDYVIYWVEGMNAYRKGLFKKALQCFNNIQSKYSQEKYSVETHLILGEIYYELMRGDSSLKQYQIALSIQKKSLDSLNPNLARTYANVGAAYLLKEQYVKAIENLTYALKIQVSSLDSLHLHSDLASTFTRLGHVYLRTGQTDKAIKYYNSALNIQNVILDSLHPKLARTFLNLGATYYTKGENDKAIEYFNHTLKIQKVVFDSLHPELARTFLNLGAVYCTKGENDKAIEYFNHTLKIQKVVLDSSHPELAGTYINLGEAYSVKGENTKALTFLNQAEHIIIKSLNNNHLYMAYCKNNFAKTYNNLGQLKVASQCIEESIRIFSKNFPKDHPDLIKAQQLKQEIDSKLLKVVKI